jgi:hypothetical protein
MSSLNHEQVRALAQVLDATDDVELDCAGFAMQMASLAERRLAGDPMPASLHQAVRHEKLCANCREECAALISALEEG